jgi:hypothetical protein
MFIYLTSMKNTLLMLTASVRKPFLQRRKPKLRYHP